MFCPSLTTHRPLTTSPVFSAHAKMSRRHAERVVCGASHLVRRLDDLGHVHILRCRLRSVLILRLEVSLDGVSWSLHALQPCE